LHPGLWILAPLAGAVLIGGVGLIGTQRLVATPPMLVLRGNAS